MENYCEFSDINNHMPDVDLEGYDTQVRDLIARASRAIDLFTKYPPDAFAAKTDTTQYFDSNSFSHSSLWLEELGLGAAPTEVAVLEDGLNYTVWSATDYILGPYNALLKGETYNRLTIDFLNGTKVSWPSYPKAVKITGRFGWVETPAPIVEATIIQTVRWFKRGQQGFKDAGAVSELGQISYTKQMDPDVSQLLQHYIRFTV